MFFLSLFYILHINFVKEVVAHGRLIEPPSRSTMWRYGFDTPPNYNDNELYCGGFTSLWRVNGGKCGICGDPWDSKEPRANEAGGLYGRGIIVRRYIVSQTIRVRIELTANHMGFFEFRICPNNNIKKVASQQCLDKYILSKANGSGTRYYPGPGNKIFVMFYKLPPGLTCQQCVFQWRYVAGNNWGMCKNGTGAVGCGAQEEFRGCADITITESGAVEPNDELNEIDVISSSSTDSPHSIPIRIQEDEEETIAVEALVIIILACILFALAFFTVIFFYYVHGNGFILTAMKKARESTLSKKVSISPWPYSNVSLKNLPPLFNTIPKVPPPPIAPPRLRRHACRPPGPPPEVPKGIEIGLPTSITINGVSIPRARLISASKSFEGGCASSDSTSLESSSADVGVVKANMVMAYEDIPDSLESNHSIPPPLPTCPPPDDDELYEASYA